MFTILTTDHVPCFKEVGEGADNDIGEAGLLAFDAIDVEEPLLLI